jgi:folate-dependent tRNA-U54 methylase TrmFO/GidA
MNVKLFRSLVVATALIGVVPAAFAAGLDGLKYQKEMTVKLKSGKTVTVMVGEMNGKTLAVIPMEDLNDFYERAEGHSMSSND